MTDYTRSLEGRASAVLTNGEVAGTALDLTLTHNSQVTVELNFTIGSLTNVAIKFYASQNGTDYYAIRDGVTAMTETLTGSVHTYYVMPPLAGCKFFRVSAQGSGTVTNSLLDYTYRWLRRGSQL